LIENDLVFLDKNILDCQLGASCGPPKHSGQKHWFPAFNFPQIPPFTHPLHAPVAKFYSN